MRFEKLYSVVPREKTPDVCGGRNYLDIYLFEGAIILHLIFALSYVHSSEYFQISSNDWKLKCVVFTEMFI